MKKIKVLKKKKKLPYDHKPKWPEKYISDYIIYKIVIYLSFIKYKIKYLKSQY